MPNIFLNHLPHTEFGAKLELTAEQEEKCRVVYKASSENKNICAFHSLWNPDEKYPDDCYIVPLRSTYDGLSDEYANGTCFINISKSTYDPKYIISGWIYDVSWIEVIRRAYAAGKVNYRNRFGAFFVNAFSFIHRNARPVSDELIRAGESVEQCGFAAVGVTRKSNTQIHFDSLSFFKVI